MITWKKAVLLTNSTRIAETLSSFEALTLIDANNMESADDLTRKWEEVWSFNKTPVVFVNDATDHSKNQQITFEDLSSTDFVNQINGIWVPEELFDFNSNNTEASPYKPFINWCYSKGFEPGEYCNGNTINTRKETCVLCTLVNHKAIAFATADYNREVDKEVDLIIYESRNFIVLPELGALKPGYLMIVPKEHKYLSVAQIDDDYIMQEYGEVCHDVEAILKGAFGHDKTVSFFEHGSGPSGFTSHPKSIVHAHTHAVIGWTLQKKYMDMIQMHELDDIRLAANTHYFAYKEGANGVRYCCYDDRVYVQRQFPRQIMANEQGYAREQYNWRTHKFLDNVHATVYRIWEYLARNWSNIDTRIARCTAAFVSGYGDRI